jgi:hypothetical protein
MVSGALDRKCRFIEVGHDFPDVLLGSQALRCPMPRKVLGVIAASPSFTWLLSLSTWGLMWMG